MRVETIGDATLYLGDCLEILPTLDALTNNVLGPCEIATVTDPPYGVNYSSGWDNEFRNIPIHGDEDIEVRDKALSFADSKSAIVFGSWKMPRPSGVKLVLIWDKGTVGMGDLSIPWFPSTEEIYVVGEGFYGSRVSSVLRFHVRNENHPTEKPAALMSHLIGRVYAKTILDPFMGSGTTGVACANLGRQFIGIEIEPRYFDIACDRIANAYKQPRLFDDAPPQPTQQELLP